MIDEPEDVGPILEQVIGGLVDHPDAIRIDREERGNTIALALRVDPRDLGQVIGRQGRTARALRALLEARGAEEGRHYDLEIKRT